MILRKIGIGLMAVGLSSVGYVLSGLHPGWRQQVMTIALQISGALYWEVIK